MATEYEIIKEFLYNDLIVRLKLTILNICVGNR
jgi:hypothetical protein